MVFVTRVTARLLTGGLVVGGLIAGGLLSASIAQAQSNGPSTTGGALPYIIGPAKPSTDGAPKPSSDGPAATVPATPGVRVIDLSKREPDGAKREPAPAAKPTIVSGDADTRESAKPATVPAREVVTPALPSDADRIATTPPVIDAPKTATAPAAPAVMTPPPPPTATAPSPDKPARSLADAPKPKAKPRPKVATAKPAPLKRPPPITTRVEPYDVEVEVDVVAPRPLTTRRAGRLAGYDHNGRPIYYRPSTPPRDRLYARAPRYDADGYEVPPPSRLRTLEPLGYLRPFPPGEFRARDCQVVFYTDESGFTRRTTRCR